MASTIEYKVAEMEAVMSAWAVQNDRVMADRERDAHLRECTLIAAFVRAGYTRGQAARMAWNHMTGTPALTGANGGPALND